MPTHGTTRRAVSGLTLAALCLAAAACGGFSRFFGSRTTCPGEAVVAVANNTQESVDVILVHESAEMTLGVARPGRSMFALPSGTSKGAKFKSRRTRAGPRPADPGAGLLLGGGVSFQVQCR